MRTLQIKIFEGNEKNVEDYINMFIKDKNAFDIKKIEVHSYVSGYSQCIRHGVVGTVQYYLPIEKN
jgi:hypothetical protein